MQILQMKLTDVLLGPSHNSTAHILHNSKFSPVALSTLIKFEDSIMVTASNALHFHSVRIDLQCNRN